MPKKILYLDQNFVSNLAKVENDPGWKDPSRNYYEALLAALRSKVNQNRLACPTSDFHRKESEQSSKVKDFVWLLVEELGRGLSFNSSTQVQFGQIALAAQKYCAKSLPPIPEWAVAFNQDPQQRVTQFPAGQVLVHLESPQELTDYSKKVAGLVAKTYGKFKSNQQQVSFAAQVQIQKYQLLAETFIPAPVLLQTYPELANDLGMLGAAAMTEMQAGILEILERCHNSEGFWKSQELLACPFLHCRASLMAANICFYPHMKTAPSLNTDFDMVASVLPYVDMLATDNHMAELIRQAKLSSEFGAKVYSMSQGLQFLEALENLG